MIVVGVDVGSTTVKAVAIRDDLVVWRDYRRHFAKPAEQVLAFLDRMQAEIGLLPERDRLCFTGSGSGLISPLVGGKEIQEVVAVAAAVENRHPDVHFVSEIGGEDMKAIFFKSAAGGRAKQVYMQTACSGGTGTFIEKTARKLRIPAEHLSDIRFAGVTLHKVSAKCGIFAETDANSLLKGGVPVGEIIASLFDAVVHQNLAALTKGNTPLPQVLLLGGPNRFFRGLQDAWRHHLGRIWAERGVEIGDARPADRIQVPDDGLYYAALGCVAIGSREPERLGRFTGREELAGWVREGRQSDKAAQGRSALVQSAAEADAFREAFAGGLARHRPAVTSGTRATGPLFVGCDFGSTTAKAAVLSPEKELVLSTYVQSHGNPIEDAKALFRTIAAGGVDRIARLALTGYGKDLLVGILGADLGVVETVAHAKSAQDVFPNADVICDVGGTDVKIMILRQGTVADFRLNSQCSSGNGAFLQGVAERYGVPLEAYAERAFAARAMPSLMMGCGVFLQSDIIRQQRHGWSPDEIMASLAAILPLNVWVYAAHIHNLSSVGRCFVLQGGTHRNLAVVKAQVDFITAKVPDAEILIHPYAGEAGAIGAALAARDAWREDRPSGFRGFDAVERLEYRSTTSGDTTCVWCPVHCRRTFIDVRLKGSGGRPWSKVPLDEGWERIISGNACPKGQVEDVNEVKLVKREMEELRRAFPNVGELVRKSAFRRSSEPS